jgi:hypothetical protein
MNLVSYGRWCSDWGKVELALDRGESVHIHPATTVQHDWMCDQFDRQVDILAAQGFVAGIGNFDVAAPPANITSAVLELKERARTAGRGAA